MKDSQYLGTYAGISLIVTITITKVLISTPSLYVKHSLSAGWLEVLLSGIFEFLILAVVLKLMFFYNKMDIVDISELAFGKIGKVITGVFSCFIFVIMSAAVFRSFAEMVRNTIMRGTSYEKMAFFLLAATLTGAYLGLRTHANLNGIILPLLLISVTIILIINSSRISFFNIKPYFGVGITKVISNALLRNASFFEVGIILYIMPYFKNKMDVKKVSFTSLGVSVFVASLITLLYQLSVPYEAAGTFALPLYQMTRMIKAGTFFQRIEPLNLFLWGGAMFVYVGLGIWLSAHTFKKTFDIKNYRPLVFIFGVIICFTALIPGSETSVERIFDFLMTYSYIAYPLLPLCLLIVAGIITNKDTVKG